MASFATLVIPASEVIPLVGIIHAVRRKICRTGLDSRSSGYFLHVPTVGMAWMAGCIGSILAVRLLGRASIYLMAPASQAIGLTNMSGVVLGSGQRRRAAVSSRAVRPAPAACPLGGLSDLTSESPRGIHHGQKCRCRHPSSLCSFFFVVIAGLTVRARITGRQDRQYVLVNGPRLDRPGRCTD